MKHNATVSSTVSTTDSTIDSAIDSATGSTAEPTKEKTTRWHLLPKTLFGQLGLIMLTGLIIAQLLAAYVLLHDRGTALYESSGWYIAQRIAGVVRLVDSLNSEQRTLLIPSLNSPTLRVSIHDTPQLKNNSNDIHSRHLRQLLTPLLESATGEASPLHVEIIGKGNTTGLDMPHSPANMNPMMAPHRMPMSPLHMQHNIEQRRFYVEAQLGDGRWISLIHGLPQNQLLLPNKLLLTLSILIIPVVFIALLAVRKVTRPLHTLGQAAEAFGRDIHHPALIEQGPQEARQAIRAFNDMQKHISRHIQDRERFLAAVSHDLKTPITRLRLRTEMLDDEALREKFLHDLHEMEQMTNATLDYIRDEQQQETIQPIDVMALLESLQADHEAMGESVSISGTAKPISARPNALKRCLENLLNNAVKYAGKVEMDVRDNAQQLVIRVKDNGPGIPPEQLAQVFEPFYRLEASRNRETGGAGLGLSIARDIARAHGGELNLHNRKNGGLEAVLTLPR